MNIGDVVAGKYRIDRVLGVGGMGVVTAATHLDLGQPVALKFMLPEALASPSAVDRFLREARAAVRLRSEHVCRVLDVGRLEAGAPYIVMEYMDGQDFAKLLEQRGQLQIQDAVDYMLQVLAGMADAHANAIVHRDLKPGNIFVTTGTDGTPLLKVLDFGISKSVGGAATKTGELMGSPMYMAPEQMASSKHVDARADIWALGCILYEALTAQLPFSGETLPMLCVSVMTEAPPPVQQLRADLPAPLAAAIMRCLEKSPEARFADVGRLATALAPFGSRGADAVALRIGRVLGRSSEPAINVAGFAATVASDSQVNLEARVGSVSTLTAGASEIMREPRTARSRLPIIAAALGAAGVAVAIVVVATNRGEPARPPTAAASAAPIVPPVVAPAPAPTPEPKPEPPPDPKLAAARAHLGSVIAAFVRWSSTHASTPCPSRRELSKLIAGGTKDPWGNHISITCTEQPEDQMMGAVSLGPDGVRSGDDVASWMLGSDLTGLIRGPRWSAGAPARPSRHATPTRTTPPVTSTRTTPPPPPPPVAVEPIKPDAKKPGTGFGPDGLPLGRTTK